MERDAKQIVTEYFDRLLNQRDLGVCDQLLAPTYIDHDAGTTAEPGPQQTKNWVGDFLRRHAQMQVEVQDIFTEDDKVAARLIWRGTEADSGAVYHREGLVILHLDKEGRITERWSAYF